MEHMEKIAILIPSLSPDQKLVTVVQGLIQAGFHRILVVNDGSSESYQPIFHSVRELSATVINHAVNLGKGRAIKTGLNYIVSEWKECTGVVTVDSDGQHRVEDIITCAEKMKQHPESLILGSRVFSGGDVPFRSRFGNKITSKVMKLLLGVSISDTQTGLRAFSAERMKQFITIRGERFEYEMNMLLYAKEEDIPLIEVPINTVYIEENKSSHFRPFRDSIMIYSLFIKYIFASLSSFVIDIALFSLFVFLFRPIAKSTYIFQATVLARIMSSIFNFIINRTGVFKSKENLTGTILRYYTLAVVQMCVSAESVKLIHQSLLLNESVTKVIVDCLLFFISFGIQREWVFKTKLPAKTKQKK